MLEFEGAMATSMRPQGFAGRPLAPAATSFQVLPPSADRKSALPLGALGPSPPERNVHPLRRKSQRPASSASGFFGSMATVEQPVERLEPLSTSAQVLPPSVVL